MPVWPGGPDPVGKIEHRLDGQAGAGEQRLQPGQRDRAQSLDPGDATRAVDRGLVEVDVEHRLGGQRRQVHVAERIEQVCRECGGAAGIEVQLLLLVAVLQQQREQLGGPGQPAERDRPQLVGTGLGVARRQDLGHPGDDGLDPDRVAGLDAGDDRPPASWAMIAATARSTTPTRSAGRCRDSFATRRAI